MLLACGCGGRGSESKPGGGAVGWFAAHPALADRSSWRQDVESATRPDERQLGPVGVGNGKVFGILGDGYPLATWHNLGGPTYHRPIKWFSDETPYVVAEGTRRTATHESLSYVRRAPVAIVESGDGELDWNLVALAPRGAVSPGADQALVSVWIVHNRSQRTIADVGLEVDGLLSRYDGAGLAESDTGDRRVLVRAIHASTGPTVTPSGEKGITFPIGELRPGEERVIPIANVFVIGGASPQPILDALASDGVDALLDATLAWWRDWFRSAASGERPIRRSTISSTRWCSRSR